MEADTIDPRDNRKLPLPEEHVAEDTLTIDKPQDELWREEQFKNLGINEDLSKWLAFNKADWQKARTMIERGCDPDVAADILL